LFKTLFLDFYIILILFVTFFSLFHYKERKVTKKKKKWTADEEINPFMVKVWMGLMVCHLKE